MAFPGTSADDIFADWKKNRFVIADDFAKEYFNERHAEGTLIVLTDFRFWGQEHIADQLVQWCINHGCRTQGATVEIPNKETLTAFMLRWL
jgi:hypothetical protein